MAVYTEIGDDALKSFVAGYGIGAVLSCKGIAEGVENTNYLLLTEKGSFILTLYEKRVKEADLPFFIGLMEHLAGKGIPCPTPVHDKRGKALGRLAERPAALVTFLSGVWPRQPTAQHCAEVGQALAKLHLAGADFPLHRANDLSLAGWRNLWAACRDRADLVHKGLGRGLEEELATLAASWPKPGGADGLPFGVIHADLFPDNVFFLDKKLSGIIDFYFACEDFYVYELAIALNAWCFEIDGSFNVTKARQLLRAYRKVRPPSAAELECLPLFARGAALRFLLTRLYDWLNRVPGALVKPKDPLEYLHKLNFHRRVASAGAYGLD
jgi:homoserine kinase type II